MVGKDECLDGKCGLPSAAVTGGPSDLDDDLFASLIGSDETPQETVSSFFPETIPITERCMELGYLIGPETKKQGHDNFEVGGFFVFDPDNHFYFKDFIVPQRLPVFPWAIVIADHFDETTRTIIAQNERNGTNFKIGAMFHIHPTARGHLSHSGPDNDSLNKLLNKLARVTRTVHETPYRLIEGTSFTEESPEGICLRGDALTDAIVRYVYPDDTVFRELLLSNGISVSEHFDKQRFLAELIGQIGPKTFEPRVINYAFSFVFDNNRTSPYVKMGVEESFALSKGTQRYYSDKIPLRVVEKGIQLPTAQDVERIVREHVVFPKPQPFVRKVVKHAKGHWITRQFSGYSPTLDDLGFDNLPGNSWPDASGYGSGVVTYVNSAPPASQSYFIKKGDNTKVDIVLLFVLSLYDYAHRQVDPACLYSQYVADLLKVVGTYENTAKPGLRTAVQRLGALYADGESVVDFSPIIYSILGCAGNINDEFYSKHDTDLEGTVQFMWDFANGTLDQRNKALEAYVTSVITVARVTGSGTTGK